MRAFYKGPDALKAKSDALVLGVYSDWEKSTEIALLDKISGGDLTRRAKKTGFDGKSGAFLSWQCRGEIAVDQVVLWGLGERKVPDAEEIWTDLHKLTRKLASPAVRTLSFWMAFEPGLSETLLVSKIVQGVMGGAYRFDHFKPEKERKKNLESRITELHLYGALAKRTAEAGIARGLVFGESVNYARDLINEPAETMSPKIFAEQVARAAKTHGIKCQVEDEKQIARRGMNLFLAVARGSANPPRLITLTYAPPKAKGKPVVLIGKGLMFDSGGYSLKPTDGMETMKCDMSGAAAVVASIFALARLNVQRKVIAIVAACENMIGGKAYKLGDVYRGMNGKTVEIMNTDAEGRLTLADALAYGESFKPEWMVDVATLTGACSVALGQETVGMFGADDALNARVQDAFKRAGEDVWPLPLNNRLHRLIKSEVASIKNTGGRYGGAITAALFLKEFVDSTPWVHLDIAGPAFHTAESSYFPKGAAGSTVSSLIELVDPTP